jgi:hypothetical protein
LLISIMDKEDPHLARTSSWSHPRNLLGFFWRAS